MAKTPDLFGGNWTLDKLRILGKYLDEYTTALKNQSFSLIYIDAFAGSGRFSLRHQAEPSGPDLFDETIGQDPAGVASTRQEVSIHGEDSEFLEFLDGSTEIAAGIVDRPFDELVFIEKDRARCDQLASQFNESRITIHNSEANTFLQNLGWDWASHRGVLFLDPFGTQVEMRTLRRIASMEALDTWILFPVGTIARLLPRKLEANPSAAPYAERLMSVFGDDSWKNLYRRSDQSTLFGPEEYIREKGHSQILELYIEKLEQIFGDRLLSRTRPLKNSRNSTIFEFIFCVGSPSGIGPAHRIAGHIIKHA